MAVSIGEAMLVYRTFSGNGSVLAFCEAVGGQHSRRDVGLLPKLHGTAALSMVMVSAGFF